MPEPGVREGMTVPRDGAFILSDVRGLTLSIVREPCGRRETYSVAHLMERHGDADDRSAADARRLPEGALGQHPRSVRGGTRKAFISLPDWPSAGMFSCRSCERALLGEPRLWGLENWERNG